MRRSNLSFLVLMFVLAASGCRTRLNRSRTTEESPAATAVTATPSAGVTKPAVPKRRSLAPVGPRHAVVPGYGVGPIGFGSTLVNVERHMKMKCDEVTETHCRMIEAGIDFELTSGVVSGIVIHRFDRPVEGSPGKTWGVFAGGIPPAALMTMVPEAVIENLGPPQKTEEVTGKNPNGTVRRDTYDGMVLEYDYNPATQRLMLGGIRIIKKTP